MQKIVEWVSDIIVSPGKSLVTTVSTAATGTILDISAIKIGILEACLRNGAWAISIVVGVCTIISFVEKQYDRFKKKKEHGSDKI